MHGHNKFHALVEGAQYGPGFPDRGAPDDRFDRFGGAPRGRGGGRGKGRGRHGGFGAEFGPGFGPPLFGRGPKRGRGDVRAAILTLLAEEPMHGYQIITELAERSGGAWRPSPGSVYPTLQAMEDQGLVTADKAEGRRVFSLTDTGRAEAQAIGDGPAPWEDAVREADRSLVDLRRLMTEVAAATMQVGRAGSEQQVRAVGEILSATRRRIYLVLAEGAEEDTASEGTASEGTASEDATTDAVD